MFQKFFSWIRGVFMHLFQVKQDLGVDVATSSLMQQHIELWQKMFLDKAPWLDDESKSLSLPAAITNEIARLVMVENKIEISGSRGAFLSEQLQPFLTELQNNVEYAAAGGGMVFKPYIDGKQIKVDCVPAWRFFPIAFSGRNVIDALFLEPAQRGKLFYTRVERHTMTDNGYRISNTAYKSYSENDAGACCALSEVDAWTDIEPEVTLGYQDGTAPEKALFSYFRIPWANNIEPHSPLGVSVFSRAESLIRQADLQYGRVLWEYEGGELAVDASEYALRSDKNGNVNMPKRDQRLFRGLNMDGSDNGAGLYKVFSPTLRDESLFNGLNQLLRRIEFNCGLSYGTLSDPQNVDKTAEEIRSSKQRSFNAVSAIQRSLQGAIEHLLWAMDFYASLYHLAPNGSYEASFTWGDGILEDTDAEFIRRKQLVDSGYLGPEYLLSWYFGTTEEEARKMMPDNTGLTFG